MAAPSLRRKSESVLPEIYNRRSFHRTPSGGHPRLFRGEIEYSLLQLGAACVLFDTVVLLVPRRTRSSLTLGDSRWPPLGERPQEERRPPGRPPNAPQHARRQPPSEPRSPPAG